MFFGMPSLIEFQDLRKDLALCRELGLDFIELNMNYPAFDLAWLEENIPVLRDLTQTGVFFTVHLDELLNPGEFNPLVRGAYFETVRRTIRCAAAIGIPVLNMHMTEGIRVTLPDRKVLVYEQCRETYLQNWADFIAMCENAIGSNPIKICIENTGGFYPFQHSAIALALNSPVFRLTWDIGHSKANQESDLPFLMKNEASLAHFHIHDGTEDPPRNHLALGDGSIDLAARLNLAKKHSCTCVIETKTAAALRASITYLENTGWKDKHK